MIKNNFANQLNFHSHMDLLLVSLLSRAGLQGIFKLIKLCMNFLQRQWGPWEIKVYMKHLGQSDSTVDGTLVCTPSTCGQFSRPHMVSWIPLSTEPGVSPDYSWERKNKTKQKNKTKNKNKTTPQKTTKTKNQPKQNKNPKTKLYI